MATKLGKVGILDIILNGDIEGLKQASRAGATTLDKVGGVAKSAASSVAKFTAAVGAASAAVFAFTKRIAEKGDQFAKMSAKVGASTEFLSAFAHAVKLGGGSAEGMEKSIGRMARVMSDASNGLATAKRSFDDLDIEVQKTDGSLRAVPEVLLEVADRIAGMTDATKQAALAQEIFGRGGLQLLPVLKQGSAAIREHMEEARRLGIVWSAEAAKAAEDFNDNIERLGRGVEGISMQLAGPLIKALGDTAGAFLAAQRAGEGFGDAMLRAVQILLTGTDLQKWESDMAAAGEQLLGAQQKLDQALRVQGSPGMKEFGTNLVRQAREAVDQASAEIARLRDIKPILLGPDAPADGKPKPPPSGGGGMTDAQKKEQEALRKLLGEQYQWELDEEQRVREELGAIYIAAHEKRLADEKQLQADLQAAKIEAYDWEQAQAIAQGEELLAIDASIAAQKQAQRQREQQANAQFWDNLAGLMNTGSKKSFEIGKAFSLGQAAVKGASAVMSAWEAGMSTGGPWAPAVAAAYAAAAGLNALNMMNNIRKQQFGGGGGAPVHPTQGASNISPVGAGGGGGQQQGQSQSMTHIIKGLDPNSLFSGRQLRELLNEGTRDGDRWVFE
jgi:hypothetical protein